MTEEEKKHIKILEDRICSLRRKNASLENKVEKMKCCANCSNIITCENRNTDEFCSSCEFWEFK